jgi:hypothetical protein
MHNGVGAHCLHQRDKIEQLVVGLCLVGVPPEVGEGGMAVDVGAEFKSVQFLAVIVDCFWSDRKHLRLVHRLEHEENHNGIGGGSNAGHLLQLRAENVHKP